MDDKNSSTSDATEATAPAARAHHAGGGSEGLKGPHCRQSPLKNAPQWTNGRFGEAAPHRWQMK